MCVAHYYLHIIHASCMRAHLAALRAAPSRQRLHAAARQRPSVPPVNGPQCRQSTALSAARQRPLVPPANGPQCRPPTALSAARLRLLRCSHSVVVPPVCLAPVLATPVHQQHLLLPLVLSALAFAARKSTAIHTTRSWLCAALCAMTTRNSFCPSCDFRLGHRANCRPQCHYRPQCHHRPRCHGPNGRLIVLRP